MVGCSFATGKAMDGKREISDAATALATAQTLVLKVGSSLLVDGTTGALRQEWLQALMEDVAQMVGSGRKVVLVSSGSIALGRGILGLPPGPLPLDQSQAAAATGQIKLAQAYQAALSAHGLTAAQVLVTLEDTQLRRRYLNSRATLAALLDLGVVPIVNENDTVATDEIRYGDNDRLAAQVASLVGAHLLVLLSDVDGLYTANPRNDTTARHLPLITGLTPEVEAMAGGAGTVGARGGMKTKLMAARIALEAGADMIITHGGTLHPIAAIEAGAQATLFRAEGDPKTARKRWIGAMKPKGALHVDAGAARALAAGKSLLPAGVTAVTGVFQRGDPVNILGPEAAHISVALAGYDAAEARLILGRRSQDIEGLLGHPGRAAMVHRDDMAI